MSNYSSTRDHGEQVRLNFEADARVGMMREMPLSQAMARYGSSLNLAALGAIEKKRTVGT